MNQEPTVLSAVPEQERKKPGRKPGSTQQRPREVIAIAPASATCRHCEADVAPMTIELARELIRIGRDRAESSEPAEAGKSALIDLMYLGARLDGFCSSTCRANGRA